MLRDPKFGPADHLATLHSVLEGESWLEEIDDIDLRTVPHDQASNELADLARMVGQGEEVWAIRRRNENAGADEKGGA